MSNQIAHGNLEISPEKEVPHWMFPNEVTTKHNVYSNLRLRAGKNPAVGHFLELDTKEGYWGNGLRAVEKRTMITLNEQDMRALRDYLNEALGE